MTLIKRLGKTEGVFGGEGGFPLKGRKIVKLRSDLLGRLFLLGDGASLALAAFCDEHCLFLVPDPFGTTVGMSGVFFEVYVNPFAFVVTGGDAECAVDFGVKGGFKGLDFLFALRKDCEGWGLNSTGSCNVESTMTRAEAG